LRSTATNERGPRYAQQAFANLRRCRFSLLALPIEDKACLAIECSDRDARLIARELHAAYPDVALERIPETTLHTPGKRRWRRHLTLHPHFQQLNTYDTFWNEADRTFTDPVGSLLGAIAPRSNVPIDGVIALDVKPCSWLRRHWFARRSNRKGLDPTKARHQLYRCRLTITVTATRRNRRLARRRLHEIMATFGQFVSGTGAEFYTHRIPWPRFVLSDGELATIWHPTTVAVKAPTMETNDSRELEAPRNVSSGKEEGSAVLGATEFRGERKLFAIKQDDRRRHLAIIGKTGMGKSTLLQKLIASDMIAGRGVGLIDPHGDLAEDVLRLVPKRRTNDVILLDAGDRDFPPAFNPFDCGQGSDRSLVASGIVTAFKKLYGDSWGPRLEYILRNAVLALLEVPGTTMLSLQRMLSDKHYRERLVSQIIDPLVRSFWLDEFAVKPLRFQEEAIAPVQNKIGQFLSSPLLRAIVGQTPGLINLRHAMDEEKILIVNLSKGSIGEDASTLFGALLVTGLQQASMSRSDLAEDQRRDFYLYVDEFQNFATESFATILSEARKYRLNLTIANQYLDQMEEGTRHAVFGNVGSLLCFQVGTTDAEALAEQLAGDLAPSDLIALPKYHAYCRLLIDGMPSRPFSMATLPIGTQKGADRLDIIRRTSARRYARPRSQQHEREALLNR
jgi:hypothetical protein